MRSDPTRRSLHDQPRSVPGLHHARKRPKGDLRVGDRVRWTPRLFGDLYHATVAELAPDWVVLDVDKHQVAADPAHSRVSAPYDEVERIV